MYLNMFDYFLAIHLSRVKISDHILIYWWNENVYN